MDADCKRNILSVIHALNGINSSVGILMMDIRSCPYRSNRPGILETRARLDEYIAKLNATYDRINKNPEKYKWVDFYLRWTEPSRNDDNKVF